MIEFGLWIGYILMILGAAAMLGFSFKNILGNPKKAKPTLYGVGAMLVIFLISWVVSSGDLTPKMASLSSTESSSKMIGAGFIMLYLMVIIGIGVIFYTEIKNIFSKK